MFDPLAKLKFKTPFYIGRDSVLGLLKWAIPNEARKTHTYLIGKSGKGKSKLLEHLATQDIRAGRGVCVVDPHQDLADDILQNLLSSGFFEDEQNYKRVIYFEPHRSDFAIPFNVLNVSGFEGQSHILAGNIIEAFRRAWPDSLKEAPRFVDTSRPALRVLIEAKQTLAEYRYFLTNPAYREQCLERVQDKQLEDDFRREYLNPSRDDMVNIDSVKNKLGSFVYDPDVRRCMGLSANVLDFRRLMDEQKILIVNLAHLAPDTQRLIGSLITVGFEQAAFTREQNRTPYYVYLDEFQQFCANSGSTQTLSTILSQCRKYGLRLTLAHQQIEQLDGNLISALGNVGVKIAFCSEYEDARSLVHKFWIPDEGETIKVDQSAGAIQRLRERSVYVKVDGWRTAFLKTEYIRSYKASRDDLAKLKTELLEVHGVEVNSSALSGVRMKNVVFAPSCISPVALLEHTQRYK